MARACVVVLVSIVLIGPQPLRAAVTQVPILVGPATQLSASSNGGFLGWTQNSERRPTAWHAWVVPLGGGAKTRLDPAGTLGYFGDIGQSSNEAIYQQVDGAVSDIYLVPNVSSPIPAPLDAVNTARWEEQPRLSNGYVLFVRELPGRGVRRLLLFDRSTPVVVTVAELPFGAAVFTGDVGAQYATWTVCRRTCEAWLWSVGSGGGPQKIPTVAGRPQYAPVVDEVHSFVYWVRSKPGCGVGVRFWKAPVADLTQAVRVASLPPGFDTGWRSSLQHDNANRIDLIFTRFDCAMRDSDIYELQNVARLP